MKHIRNSSHQVQATGSHSSRVRKLLTIRAVSRSTAFWIQPLNQLPNESHLRCCSRILAIKPLADTTIGTMIAESTSNMSRTSWAKSYLIYLFFSAFTRLSSCETVMSTIISRHSVRFTTTIYYRPIGYNSPVCDDGSISVQWVTVIFKDCVGHINTCSTALPIPQSCI